LKVIKSKLTLWERGEEGGVEGELPEVDPQGEPISRADLQRRSGLTSPDLDALIAHGLIVAISDHDGLFPAWALSAAIEARHLLGLGFEARHLRQVRLAAEREADLLRQMLVPALSSPQAETRELARKSLADGAEAVSVLHRILLSAQLHGLIEE
jgi:hypothetical protein